MADYSEGQRIARACSVDYERLYAGRVPLPGGEDFRKGGHIYNAVRTTLRQVNYRSPAGP